MARITVNLESLASLYHDGSGLVKALVKNAMACEMAGADGVLISITKELDHKWRKAVSALVDSLEIGITVKAKLDEKQLDDLQDLKPAMVIIPYDSSKKESLANIVTNLQVEHILVGMEISLETELVKQAAKFKCDYAVLDCQAFCSARDFSAQIDELNKIGRLVALSSRLSVGVIAAGPIEAHHLTRLSGAARIEEYILGLPLLSSALVHGYAQAIKTIKSALVQS
jgi:pyridoxine 5'-phosphate synthase PdxJ